MAAEDFEVCSRFNVGRGDGRVRAEGGHATALWHALGRLGGPGLQWSDVDAAVNIGSFSGCSGDG